MVPRLNSNPLRFVLAALVLTALVSACSRPPAEVAAEELAAGLEAHVDGDFNGATEHYNSCLAQEPTNKFCNYNLGLIAQTQNRLTEAENFYRLALANDGSYAPAVFNLAIVLTALEDADAAIALYRQYVQLMPDDAGGHLNLGLLLIANGAEDEGQAEVERATELDPTINVPQASPGQSPDPSSTPEPSAAPSA